MLSDFSTVLRAQCGGIVTEKRLKKRQQEAVILSLNKIKQFLRTNLLLLHIRMSEYLVISTNVELVRTAAADVVFVLADGNYSTLMLAHGEQRMVTLQLGQIEKLIEKQLTQSGGDFIRIGKSLIINRQCISYINIPKQQLTLYDGHNRNHTLTASKEALKQLKAVIENDLKD